jgi:hypothetical protein
MIKLEDQTKAHGKMAPNHGQTWTNWDNKMYTVKTMGKFDVLMKTRAATEVQVR